MSRAVRDETETDELANLARRWRDEAPIVAADERRLARLLADRAAAGGAGKPGETDLMAVLREVGLEDDDASTLAQEMLPLVDARDLSTAEKNELAALFDQFRFRLWCKLNRSIGVEREGRFDADDVLSESYIRAETRWHTRPSDPARYYIWLYGIVHDQLRDMIRGSNAQKRGGRHRHERIPDDSMAEIALQLWQSRTGASTHASRNEFLAKFQGFLGQSLGPVDCEILSMRIFDRLEYQEIADELARRGESAGNDAGVPCVEAIRKRFKRAIKKLTAAILTEFPELLDPA